MTALGAWPMCIPIAEDVPRAYTRIDNAQRLERFMADAGIETILVLLLAGLAAGWFAGIVTRGNGFGTPGNILVASAGAVAGLYAGGWIGLGSAGGLFGTAIAALLGAFALLYVVAQFRR